MANLRVLLLAAIFLTTIKGTGSANAEETNPFKAFFNNAGEEKNETVLAAEKIYNRFSNQHRELDFDITNNQQRLRNPFLSQIPQDVEPPVQNEIMDPIPITAIPDDMPLKDEPPPNFSLAGLVWNTEKPTAILDNSILGVGDSIKGWRITDINQKGVTIESANRIRYLIQPKEVLNEKP
ncbi:MAG TPA: hypothetical protein VLJ10_04600 [Candidatus Bathyarchaeia archaeon]|nr:hypothetical protein [Candidatus Bathyarchaeia archaeon]